MTGRRDHYTPDQWQREREANRLRMAAMLGDPTYRAQVNAKRRARDAERKAVDPTVRQRLNGSSKRYYASRRDDPNFMANRQSYLIRWRAERRAGEEFQAFVERLEAGEFDRSNVNQIGIVTEQNQGNKVQSVDVVTAAPGCTS